MIVSTLWEDPCVGCSGEKRDYSLGGGSVQVYKTLSEVAPAYPPLQPRPSNPTPLQTSHPIICSSSTKPSPPSWAPGSSWPWKTISLLPHKAYAGKEPCPLPEAL